MTEKHYPNCTNCYVVIDPWTNELVKDAWQKDGYNHYTFDCPICGTEQKLSIPIQED